MGVAELQCGDNPPGLLTLRRKVIVIFGAALGLASGLSVFLGAAGIFLKPVALSFNWSRADVAVLPMLAVIGSVIGAPCIGYIADRTGWNKVIAFSIMIVSLGLLAMSVAPPSHAYVVAVGLLIGIMGVATTPGGYISVISRTFDRRLGTALGFALVGVGVSAASVPVIAGKLLEIMDWRQAYACLAALSLVLGVMAHQLIFRVLNINPDEADSAKGKTGVDTGNRIDTGEGVSFGEAIRSYRFWLIGGVGVLSLFSTMGAALHLASYATDQGVSAMVAAQSAGLVGIGLMLSRIGVGLMLDKLFAPFVACVMFVAGAAGFYLLTADILQSAWALSLGAVLVGVSHGAEGDLIPFLARKYFGVRAFGSVYGALFGMAILGGAVGAYVYGMCFDLLKSYIPILQLSAVLCCICSVVILMLGRYQYATGRDEL